MGRKDQYRKGGRSKDWKRNIRKAFHIICESQNTEPDYFKAFWLKNVSAYCFGKGEQRKKLVQSTISGIISCTAEKVKYRQKTNLNFSPFVENRSRI